MTSLELGTFTVEQVVVADAPTGWSRGTLCVNPAQLQRELLRDTRLARVAIDVARPGERTRIVHVLDAIEPRVKVAGGRSPFPGILGPVELAGRGRTHRLAGVAVLTTVDEFWVHDGLSLKEAIVDMSGPGAAYSPFSETANLVVSCGFAPTTGYRDRTGAVVRAGLRAAELLAEGVRHADPDSLETIELARAPLPRVAFLCFLMTEGDVHQTYVYGENVVGPSTLMNPTEVLDGAIVSGNYHTASNRNVTYLQQNNPIVRGLIARHGRDVDLVGVLVAKALAPLPEDKQRLAQRTGVLADMLGLDGVIISKDSAGHSTVDFMSACRELERRGIKTVLVSEEFAGADGEDLSLAYYVNEADAMISTGNRDEIVALPAMDRALGGAEILNPDRNDTIITGPASSAFETSLRRILCSANQVGAGRLTARTV